jgi:DNA-binding Lrp family transcriptional regulator
MAPLLATFYEIVRQKVYLFGQSHDSSCVGEGRVRKLSDSAKKILGVVQTRAEMPLAEVARKTRLKVHTVRYELAKLLEARMIRYYPFINVYPLGFTPHLIYCTLSAQGKRRRKMVLGVLAAAREVCWICEIGGVYNLVFSVLARSARDLEEILTRLWDQIGGALNSKTLLIQTALTLYNAKYLFSAPANSRSELRLDASVPVTEIDKTDHLILAALVQKEYSSYRELSRLVSIPASTFDERIKQLKKSCVIAGTVFLTAPLKLDIEQFKLLVHTRGVSSNLRSRFRNFCLHHPNIVVLVETIGAWDFEVSVEVIQSSDVVQVQSDIEKEFADEITDVDIVPLFEEHKVVCFPF